MITKKRMKQDSNEYRPLYSLHQVVMMRVCPRCFLRKPITDFYEGKTHPYCKECTREIERNKYQKLHKKENKKEKPKRYKYMPINQLFERIKELYGFREFTISELAIQVNRDYSTLYLQIKKLIKWGNILKDKSKLPITYRVIKTEIDFT